MGIRASDIAAKRREFTAHIPNVADLLITYRPHWMTESMERELTSLASAPNKSRAMTEAFCKIVVNWDVEDDNGGMVPLTPEAIDANGISADIIGALINEMVKDSNTVGEATGGS